MTAIHWNSIAVVICEIKICLIISSVFQVCDICKNKSGPIGKPVHSAECSLKDTSSVCMVHLLNYEGKPSDPWKSHLVDYVFVVEALQFWARKRHWMKDIWMLAVGFQHQRKVSIRVKVHGGWLKNENFHFICIKLHSNIECLLQLHLLPKFGKSF